MLWVLSAVIGLLVGAAGAWIIQASARKREAALAEKDRQVLQENLGAVNSELSAVRACLEETRAEAAAASSDRQVAQARAQMLENSLAEQKEARRPCAASMMRNSRRWC